MIRESGICTDVMDICHILCCKVPSGFWGTRVVKNFQDLILNVSDSTCLHWILLWMMWFRPAHYTWVRRALVLLTCAAMAVHLLYPLAPPRLHPRLGMVDTGQLFGVSVYSGSPHTGIANQFAAMPSLHVAWAVLVAVGIIVSSRTSWSWLSVAHPAVTLLVVVVTANHYWLDALIGIALLVGALWISRRALPAEQAEQAEQMDICDTRT